MRPASLPLAFLLLEIGSLLAVLNLGESPLGADLPASVGVVLLCALAIVVLAVTAIRRLRRWLPWVEGLIGSLLIATAGSTLLAAPAPVGRMIGLMLCGAIFVASAVARHRGAPGEQPSGI